LLQAIEGFVQTIYVLRPAGVDESGRLVAVDNLVESAIEEGILDVKLTDGPGAGDGDVEDKPNGGGLDDGAKSLVVVVAGTLGETAENPARLAPSQGAVGVELVMKDPLAGDHVGAGRLRHERPSAVVDEGLVLIGHSSAPERILNSLASRGRHGVDGVRGGEVEPINGTYGAVGPRSLQRGIIQRQGRRCGWRGGRNCCRGTRWGRGCHDPGFYQFLGEIFSFLFCLCCLKIHRDLKLLEPI
jgi:hypothetical protein